MIKEIYWGVTPAAFAIDVFVKVPMQTIVTVRYFLSRETCPHSTFMFHGVGFDMKPGVRLEEKSAREYLDSILQDQARIGNIIRDHTSLDEGQVGELFREARTKDASYAKEVGIVHEICDVNIPPGDPIISLVFKR